MTIVNARSAFSPDPDIIFLDAATYGLAPNATADAVATAVRRWQAGTAIYEQEWDPEGDRSRELFARLIGTGAERVAVVPTVSVATGIIAASLPRGSRILVPEEEFASVSYPFSVAADHHDYSVIGVPFGRLVEAIQPGIDLVAFSLVRSQSGERADLAAVLDAAQAVGARTFVDATHAIPFVDVAGEIDRIDYLACHGYKHLLCPRGAGFFVLHPNRIEETVPYLANWRVSPPGSQSTYGIEPILSPEARRFDVTPAWHSWVGARQSLELLLQWKAEGIFEGTWQLARKLAAGLGLPEPGSTVITFKAPDPGAAERAISAAGIRCAVRAGNIRLAPHVYNTEEEIDRALEVIAPLREAVAV